MKVKNKHYREFLDKDFITTLSEEDIRKALKNVTGRWKKQARSLIILLYYTGARPNEVLKVRGKDVRKERSYVAVDLPGSKRGRSRKVLLPYKKLLVREVYDYARSVFPDLYLFHAYRSRYARQVKTKKGVKERVEITDKLRYHFKKWFEPVLDGSIPPYYLRHNRTTKWLEGGASIEEIMLMRGGLDYSSVRRYMHHSRKFQEKMAKITK